MQVQMLVAIAGNAMPAYDLPEFSFSCGQLLDLDPGLAAIWIASGFAAAVAENSMGITFVDDEVPEGVIDGVNNLFTLNNAPNPASSLKLYNTAGELLRGGGVDYTLTGNQIAYAPAAIPAKGALHDCWYRC